MNSTSSSNPPPVNIWAYKPWWCQPWSILLTGVVLIGGCWLIFRILWLTILVAVPVGSWMAFFLLVYPKLMAESGLLPLPGESAEATEGDQSP